MSENACFEDNCTRTLPIVLEYWSVQVVCRGEDSKDGYILGLKRVNQYRVQSTEDDWVPEV